MIAATSVSVTGFRVIVPVERYSKRLSELTRFVVVGLLATAIQYAVYYALLPYMSANAAFTLGYVVSFLCNYGLSSRFTFRVGASLRRFVSFGVSHATNYFIQIILLNIFIGIGVSEPLAPLPVYVLAVPINYLTVRFALTRRSGENDSYWLFLMSAGFALLWLNLLDMPTLSDDMLYRFVWHADDSAPVEAIGGLGDLLRSQWTHYLTTNGRSVAHLLAQAFLAFLPPVVMQVANTLMFVLLIHLSVLWVANDYRQRLAAAATICMLLFVVFSGFRTAILWGLGAFNYLWTLVAVMTVVVALRKDGQCCKWAILPLAFLAGWSHEALSLPVSIAFLAWIAAHRSGAARGKGVTLACMLLYMAGTAIILLSPAIWQRAGEAASLQSRMVSGAVNYVFNVRVTWLLAIALLITWWRDRKALHDHFSIHRYEYIALAAALGIVLVCGVNLERVAFFADFIAMLLLINLVITSLNYHPSLLTPLIAVCCLLMLLAYIPAYMVRNENAETWRHAEAQMSEPGRELIAVRTPPTGRSAVADLLREHYVNPSFTFGFYSSYMAFDSQDVNMRCAAKLFGKERLTFLPEDVVSRIERDSTAYDAYELDRNGNLYIWHVKDWRPVVGMTFMLKKEDTSKLLPHQRLVAYKGDEYELDDFNFEVVSVCQRPYLVFTKPTTNIYRRIKDVKIIFAEEL